MSLRSQRWVVWTLGLVISAAAIAETPPPTRSEGLTYAVRVMSNGWHTAIIVSRQDVVATGLLPEAGDFPDAVYLEFGWGDREYYPAEKKTVGIALGAALTATPAVMHMVGLARAPELTYANVEVVLVELEDDGFRDLVGTIAADFKRPTGDRAAPISRGLYANSYFYDAHGTFHLFNTCNTWVARVLHASGMNLSPSGVITADGMMARLRDAVPAAADAESD